MVVTIPTHLDQITPDWLSDALQLQVDKVLLEPFSQRGYGSEIGRLRIQGDTTLPTQLIAKVLPSNPHAAGFMREVQGFTREAAFYRDIAPLTPVRTPRVFHSDWLPETGEGILLLEDCSSMQQFTFPDALPDPAQLTDIARAAADFHARW